MIVLSSMRVNGDVTGPVALVLFLSLFGLVLLYTLSRRNRETFDRAKELPLEDDA